MATYEHTPRGRGYNTSLIYFGHSNDFWTNKIFSGECIELNPNIVDLWKDNQPAYGMNGTKYEEYLFAEHVYDTINGLTDTVDDEPFFMVYAPQFGDGAFHEKYRLILHCFHCDVMLCCLQCDSRSVAGSKGCPR